MARDHFVPRHYLRQFGITEKLIGVAVLDPFRFIGPGSIGDQCQEGSFYEGHMGLNELLGFTEDEIAPILRRVAENSDFNREEIEALKVFAVIQYKRTRKSVEGAKLLPKHIMCEVLQSAIDRGELPPVPDGENLEDVIGIKGMPAAVFDWTAASIFQSATLEAKLLEAPSGSFFITSDNPVAVMNQFCVGTDPIRAFAGFGRSGFQLVLPISPRLCLFIYDGKVYKVGGRRKRVVQIDTADLDLVNSLQIQSAEKCVYFHDARAERTVCSLAQRYGTFRRSIGSRLKEFEITKKETLVAVQNQCVYLPKQWAFCRVIRHTKFRPGDHRDPLWTKFFEKVIEDIRRNPSNESLWQRIDRLLGVAESSKSKSPAL